ncbi:hypothetical protein Pmani_017090 [Petrolisthes manimaculis]|uniref:Uncharacterized protein n=1 Tax=Petrolisthes manimaculis TaxID=1843537 RepID=A0AAE1PQ86_9EUCA|nr:hypothetical protein Pmani_017090 [Petrolisthes manimaculis]
MEVAGEGLGQKRQGRESEDEVGSALEGPIRWRVCSWRVAHLPHQAHSYCTLPPPLAFYRSTPTFSSIQALCLANYLAAEEGWAGEVI